MEKFRVENINNLQELNVILVTGEGCVSCYSMILVINNLETKFKNIHFYSLDASEEYTQFLAKMDVRTIPSVLIIKDNKLIDSCHGYQPEEILELWLEAKLS